MAINNLVHRNEVLTIDVACVRAQRRMLIILYCILGLQEIDEGLFLYFVVL